MPDASRTPRSCRLQAQHATNAATPKARRRRCGTRDEADSVNLVKITRLRVVWKPEFSCALAVEIFSAAPQQAATSGSTTATCQQSSCPGTGSVPPIPYSGPLVGGPAKTICKHDRTPDLFSSLVHPLRGSCCGLLLQHHQVCRPSSWLTGWRCVSPGPRPWRHWAEPPHDISCPQHSQTWRESEPHRLSWYASQQ